MIIQKRFSLGDFLVCFILSLFALLVIIPIWQIVVISTSSEAVYIADKYHLAPRSFSLNEYARAFGSIGGITRALSVSIVVTASGTFLSMMLTTVGAYALSKRDLPGRKALFRLVLFTMFFSGGLVPFYILIRKLHLNDTILALTLPVAISTYNLVLMKNYFAGQPASLEEAAKLDGYSDLQILVKIIVPISMPMFAAIALFYGVAYWNDYFLATMFISSNKMYPLQVVLRQMIIQNLVLAQVGVRMQSSNAEQFKMACIVIGMVPVIAVYPFIQKHFTKGIMLGAVKE
jgi:putative aldouronate transport system permease protein